MHSGGHRCWRRRGALLLLLLCYCFTYVHSIKRNKIDLKIANLEWKVKKIENLEWQVRFLSRVNQKLLQKLENVEELVSRLEEHHRDELRPPVSNNLQPPIRMPTFTEVNNGFQGWEGNRKSVLIPVDDVAKPDERTHDVSSTTHDVSKKAALDEVGKPQNRTLEQLNMAVSVMEYQVRDIMETVANITVHNVGCVEDHVPGPIYGPVEVAPVQFIWTINNYRKKTGRLMESEWYSHKKFPYHLRVSGLAGDALTLWLNIKCCSSGIIPIERLFVFITVLPDPESEGGIPITQVRSTNMTINANSFVGGETINEAFNDIVESNILRHDRYTKSGSLRIQVSITVDN